MILEKGEREKCVQDRQDRNVLIVDNEPSIRQMLKDVLEIEGYRVYQAGDGAEGLAILKSMASSCVVLLDLMMSGKSGWWFLENQKLDPAIADTPVIICSAYMDSARYLKASGFLPKPFHIHALLRNIESCLVPMNRHFSVQ
jgi:CheY-like chemotaxis protein